LVSKIKDQDFLVSSHMIIFSAMKSLHTKKNITNFDFYMILEELKENGVLGSIDGGADYVRAIIDSDIADGNFFPILQSVLDASTKYKLYKKLNSHIEYINDNAKNSDVSSDNFINKVENDILNLSTESKAIKEPRNLADGLEEYIEEKRKNKVEMSGISTGFPILDKQIDGLINGTLFIVSARKKMGKSTFLTNISTYVAYREKIPVLYIDTEMRFEEWRDRMIAGLSGIDERIVKHGGYDNDTYNTIIDKCLRIVEKGKLYHEYLPGYSIEKISALYRKYKIKEDMGLGVFDYLKEPESSSIDRQRKEYQILGDVTTSIKNLAGELDIPFITAVQVNRDNDVAGSDRISWFGDVIAQWMKRDEKEIEDVGYGGHKLIIRDTRRGGATPEQGISYYFKKKCLRIREVPVHKQMIDYSGETINHGSSDYEEDDILT
jgi:replicative DNA helicase